MKVTQLTEPSFMPVSVEDLKLWCRIDDTEQDMLLAQLIESAVDYIEGATRHLMAQRKVQVSYSKWDQVLRLPLAPVTAIDSITALNAYDNEHSILASELYSANLGGLIPTVERRDFYPLGRVDPSNITVTATVGYPTADRIPGALTRAVAIMAADLYKNREGASESTETVDRMISRFRFQWLA